MTVIPKAPGILSPPQKNLSGEQEQNKDERPLQMGYIESRGRPPKKRNEYDKEVVELGIRI